MFSKTLALCGVVALCAVTVATASRPNTANDRYTMSGHVPIPLGTCNNMDLGCTGVYGIDWLSDGRMVLLTSDAVFQGNMPYPGSRDSKVSIVSGAGVGGTMTVQDISTGYKLPTGLVVVNDTIYVADMDSFYRVPTNNPNPDPDSLFANREGRLQMPHPMTTGSNPLNFTFPADQRGPSGGISGSPPGGWTNMNSFWHQYMYSPYYHQGKIYAAYSGATFAGGGFATLDPVSFFGGSVLAFAPSTTQWDTTLHRAAGGLRSPGGIGKGPDFALVADNQGGYRPLEELFPVKPFTNQYFAYRQAPDFTPNWAQDAFSRGQLHYEPSVAVMEFNEVGWRSATQPLHLPAGPYAGNWLVGSINARGIARVAFDSVPDTAGNPQIQGAAFWFAGHNTDPAVGTASHAINRMSVGPDGSIFAGTLRNYGNWATGNNKSGAGRSQLLYKFVLNPEGSQFEILKIRSLADGYELFFSKPVDPSTVTKANITVRQRSWMRELAYGGGLGSFENRPISTITISPDSMRAHLVVPGIRRLTVDQPGNVEAVTHWYTKFAFNNLRASDSSVNFTDEATYTQNWIATRTWEGGGFTAVQPARISLLHSRVWFGQMHGRLQVHTDRLKSYQAVLRDPQGRVLARKSGSSGKDVEFRAPSASQSVYVVEIRADGDNYRKVVTF